MLDVHQTVVVLVDVQERLVRVMHERERLVQQLQRLVRGARVLGLPVVWAQQHPARLGPTVPELRELLAGQTPVTKMTFNCCADGGFQRVLEAGARPQVLMAGIEAHVCVYQTARALAAAGYEVEVVADAVSSRNPEHKALALAKLQQPGVGWTCVEMALFELLQTAEAPAFKAILEIVK
ncbi:isochorismatase family protein [Limisphaera sp. VF-2]|uniref:isochorismatase family protein n=1 Tax=Limisphaera sp. VF-2 TaxID=3400418 RepID=UPI003C1B69F1